MGEQLTEHVGLCDKQEAARARDLALRALEATGGALRAVEDLQAASAHLLHAHFETIGFRVDDADQRALVADLSRDIGDWMEMIIKRGRQS